MKRLLERLLVISIEGPTEERHSEFVGPVGDKGHVGLQDTVEDDRDGGGSIVIGGSAVR